MGATLRGEQWGLTSNIAEGLGVQPGGAQQKAGSHSSERDSTRGADPGIEGSGNPREIV